MKSFLEESAADLKMPLFVLLFGYKVFFREWVDSGGLFFFFFLGGSVNLEYICLHLVAGGFAVVRIVW